MHNFNNSEKLKLSDVKQGLDLGLRFNKYLLRYWKLELVIFILGNCSMFLGLVNPYIGKLMLDKGILGKDLHTLIILSAIAAGIFLIGLILSLGYDYLKNLAVVRIGADLNRDVFRRFKSLNLGQLQNTPAAINLYRITNDVASSSTIINVTLVHFISSLIKLLIITVIIFSINPWLLLIVILYQFLVMARMLILIKPMEKISKLALKKSEELYQKIEMIFSNIYLLKAFATLGREILDYTHKLFENSRLAMTNARLRAAASFFSNISDKLFFGLLSFFGALLVIQGKITLGSLGAALAYISQGIGAYSTLTSMAGQLVLNKVSLERLANLLDAPSPKESKFMVSLKPQDIRKIEFESVSFGYQPDKFILKNLSFNIEPGLHIGLVGYSGCGKTTLISLILGLYPPQSGRIKVGNEDLANVDSAYYLNNIGIALQEPYLFNETIAYNISYGARKSGDDKIREAAKSAEALDFIDSLTDGFNTIVGENAYRISQGQKQRIAIARAIIKQPQIIVLDEATSSLDLKTEGNIINNILNSFPNSTIIVVSHRLTAVEKMDKIYFFREPGLMSIGSHKNLLEEIPQYRTLFAMHKNKQEAKE